MDRRALPGTVHRVTQNRAQLKQLSTHTSCLRQASPFWLNSDGLGNLSLNSPISCCRKGSRGLESFGPSSNAYLNFHRILSKLQVFNLRKCVWSVQSLSHVWLCDHMDWSKPGFPIDHQLPRLAQTHVYWVDDAIHLILCHPLLLPWIFPSIRVFSDESVLRIRWPKYWSFSFSISPSNEYSGLLSFRMDWLDLLAVQQTFKSLLQHHSSKASILRTQLSLWSNSHIHTLEKP